MSDQLTYDLAQQTEASPSIFVKKDYLSIIDNMGGSYSSSQCVIDSSSLSNSNRYMGWRDAVIILPLIITLTSDTVGAGFAPGTTETSCDYAVSLKNWYGSMINSVQCDWNGIGVIQQMNLQGLWNTFKLMTSLSYNDILTQGAEIGFYPDSALSFVFSAAATVNGRGTCNTMNLIAPTVVSGFWNSYDSGNIGFLKRQQYINYDPSGRTDPLGDQYLTLLSQPNAAAVWKSHIFQRTNGAAGVRGSIQWCVNGLIKCKHLHDMFAKMPPLKGVYLKITLSLNNSSIVFSSAGAAGALDVVTATSNSGGVIPLQIASAGVGQGSAAAFGIAGNFTLSVAVGNTCLVTSQLGAAGVTTSPLSRSVMLSLPSYVFSPAYEMAYLASPVKKIDYEDTYSYTVLSIPPGGTFNALITNGIANLQKLLVLPAFTTASNGGISPLYSPFDSFGTGTTSPLCILNNFQVVVSGQNQLYNTQKYSYQQFVEQLAGINSINSDSVDGLCSGLVGLLDFETLYNYYVCDISRCLEVEKSVPRSITIQGMNMSAKNIDLYVFVSYMSSISVDVLSGARV